MPGFNDQIRKLERFTTQSRNALSNFDKLATKSLEVGRNLDAGAIARGDTEAQKTADSVKAAADDAARLTKDEKCSSRYESNCKQLLRPDPQLTTN